MESHPKNKKKEILIKSRSRVQGHCHTCSRTPQELGRDKPFQSCSKCKEVCYCSVECQRENWPTHKMPCAMSQQRKQVFAQNPGQAASIARFTKWFEGPIKLEVFRQAAMQAMDVVKHPENVDKKCFHMELELHPDHKNRAPTDIFVLKKGTMFPREDIIDSMPEMEKRQLTEYIKIQNDIVKGRGQLGVVPVMMNDVSQKANTWWPLALPFTVNEAKEILENTKWGNVYWMSRLRDILAEPESIMEFVNGDPVLPTRLLRATPMGDSVWVATERYTNNKAGFDRDLEEEVEGPTHAAPGRDTDFDTDNCTVM